MNPKKENVMSQAAERKEELSVHRPTTPFDSVQKAEITDPNTRDFPFSLGATFSNLWLAHKYPPAYFSHAEEIRERARTFADRYIRPQALEIEKKVSRDPDYFHWDIMKKACDYRFFSMMIPKAFGGLESRVLAMSMMAEELAVACGGWASTIGVHSAGISCGLLTLDPYILEHFIRPTAEKEKQGEPVVWSGAVTEPQAGTDIWDEDFIRKAKIMTFAKKVSNGYVLNGRKCFISNGSIANYSVVAAALDRENLKESWTMFLVPTDSPGFSLGRVERKMGQKASPTAELIFEDLFIPTELRLGDVGDGARAVSIYLAGSRGPVGSIGVGCARRSLECLVDWAKQKQTGRGRLIDQQAMQMTIARMAQEIELGRQAYVNAALAYDFFVENLFQQPVTQLALKALPSAFIRSGVGKNLLASAPVKKIVKNLLNKVFTEDRLALASTLATLAKVKGSNVGVEVAGEATRIMGHDAFDPRWPVEKCYRDAKLTQIYEGTNQANTITFFKDMVRTWQET